MIYDIIYKEEDMMHHMDGKTEYFISDHLENIAREHCIKEVYDCLSEENHILAAILESKGIIVNILWEDGSRMDW